MSLSPSSELNLVLTAFGVGGRLAQSGEDLDADCAGFANSKGAHALADTGGSTRSITAADRESNRLRERMHVWHSTFLSQEG